MSDEIQNSGQTSHRLRFPADETRHRWLGPLLDAYGTVDEGVDVAVKEAVQEQGRLLACRRECDECCRQTDIPIYPHELVGIYWFVAEKLAPEIRGKVREALRSHGGRPPCPFLIERSCSIHPFRPVACRQFNVFTAPCARGEDPYYTRRGDVLVPLTGHTDRAFETVLPFYAGQSGTPPSVREVRLQIMNLQTFDWKKLAALVEGTYR